MPGLFFFVFFFAPYFWLLFSSFDIFHNRFEWQDTDRKVRATSQTVLAQLATRAKKQIAPHFKDLLGQVVFVPFFCFPRGGFPSLYLTASTLQHYGSPWLAAQFENTREVSEAARAAFRDVFPDETKRVRAVQFAAVEVVEHVRAHVLDHTPATLNDIASPSEDAFEV